MLQTIEIVLYNKNMEFQINSVRPESPILGWSCACMDNPRGYISKDIFLRVYVGKPTAVLKIMTQRQLFATLKLVTSFCFF